MRDDVLGRYRLLERIGIGGMAEVFVARAIDAGPSAPTVVVKRILPQLAHDDDAVSMFFDEARLGTKLRHPHIVPVLDSAKEGDVAYMVLGHVDGCDLGALLTRARALRLSIPDVHLAHLMSDVALGLHAAHEAMDPETGRPLDVVHRDVSPSNVLVSKTGEVKIADFGVARSAAQSVRTTTGAIKGKLAYMSPEQVQGEPLDRRSDVYALGVMLFELFSRRRLHGDVKNEAQLIRAILDVRPPSLGTVAPTLARELVVLVDRCLQKSREDRPASAREVAAVLDRFVATQPDGGRTAFARWLDAHDALFTMPVSSRRGAMSGEGAPVDETSDGTLARPRTPTADARPLVADEKTPVLKRVKTPSSPQQGLKLAQKGDEKKRDLVLYVEDEPENREVASLRLRRSYELLLASNDEEACAILRTRGHEIAAVLMDIQLKGSKLDGIALVRLMRGTLPMDERPPFARDVPTTSVPIFFVTAYGSRYAEQELLAAGAQKVVGKPVNFSELTLALIDIQLKRVVRS